MLVDALHYELAPERIAQRPPEDRETARLMLLDGRREEPIDHHIRDLPELLPSGTLVVVNDTRVIRARLLGTKRETHGRAEILLVRKVDAQAQKDEATGAFEVWSALGRASKGFKKGGWIDAEELEILVLDRTDGEALLEVGLRTKDGSPVADAIRRVGHVPLPPYIRRDDEALDADRYQTVFAKEDGAIAAPTAGLHLTERLLEGLRGHGCTIASITLHIGLGTFQPVTSKDLDDHPMHAEWFNVPLETAQAVLHARARQAPVLAVGTTVVRALESAADTEHPGHVRAASGETRLLIQPGHEFRVVDRLLTNFHLPRSTLLALACAFGGTERVLHAYETAQLREYRFFSYGDAMLLSPRKAT
jgi:S-adenosylmethionine:tRNA ribosyltransferase-isomerase